MAAQCFQSINCIGVPENDAYIRSSPDVVQLKASASSANYLPLRVRKTYTITKQRERWTGDEHEKFLEAIKLYGRAWRQLQEHIGTKTVLQIRSHAQKFFSKTSQNFGPGETVEIPPPRPKRKPVRPYPRKLDYFSTRVQDMKQPVKISSPVPSVSEQNSRSPVSVLAAAGSDATVSHPSNTLSKLDESPVDLSSEVLKWTTESSPLEAQSASIKLFGRTVSVNNHLFDNENVKQRVQLVTSAAYEEEIGMHIKNQSLSFKHFESYEDPCQTAGGNLQGGAALPMYDHLVPHCVQTKPAEQITASVPFWFSGYGSLPYPLTNQLNASLKHDLAQTGKCYPTQSTMEEGIHTGEGLQCSRLWNQHSHTFRLKPSEKSAFSSVKASNKKPASL